MYFSSEIGVDGVDFGGVQKKKGGWGKIEGSAENRLVEKMVWPWLLFGRFIGCASCHDNDGDSTGEGVCHGS